MQIYDGDFQDSLDELGIDLVHATRRGTVAPVHFRENEIRRVMTALDGGRSVLVVGVQGAGKTAVIHGAAAVIAQRDRGGLRRFSTTDLMAGTRFIGEWQTKVSAVLDKAAAEGVVLYFTDVLNIRSVGSAIHDASSLLDAVVPRVESGQVQIVGEVTQEELNALERTPSLAGLFEKLLLAPLTHEQVDSLLSLEGDRHGVALDDICRKTLVEVTDRFGADDSQPRPALRLLTNVRDYQVEKEAVGEPEPVTRSFIEHVFAIYSGLPSFVVSQSVTMPVADIRARLQERIVGQRDAINAVVETITLFKARLHDPTRPIGSLLFVGPTGVGKTEVARATAAFLFGSEKRMLRFDLSEFKDYHSFQLLLGDPSDSQHRARLVDPVRAQPFQVLLFDELEKAHPNVSDMLLHLLDEGRLTPPRGQAVSFRNTLVIATSNVGAEDEKKPLGFDARRDTASFANAVRKALEAEFRPEFLNRFQHVVVFHPLSVEQVRTIARHELRRFLEREGIVERGLVVDVDDTALDLAIQHGFDERYGARALKREIQRLIVLPVAAALMERGLPRHTILRVVGERGTTRVRVVQTGEFASVSEPLELPDGQRLSAEEIRESITRIVRGLKRLEEDVGETGVREKIEELAARRAAPDFWKDPRGAALVVRDLDRQSRALDRLERLRGRVADAVAAFEKATTRREVGDVANRVLHLERALLTARRELVLMGDGGFWDALLEVQPVGRQGAVARDLLLATYVEWAGERRMKLDWIRLPTERDEPALVSLQGHYAVGYVLAEAGLHRVRDRDTVSVARVRVGPWVDEREAPGFVGQRAIKAVGAFGKRIRSRVECAGGLVLQNDRTIVENRDLAAEVAPSWAEAPQPPDSVVRRYDLSPFQVRDQLAGVSTGKRTALTAGEFHKLLCARIDARGHPAGA